MTFTNEDHLHVHTKKHDMVLQLGLEQKAAFVADQTPTPTRFIRNCEEVGLFQDLQNVNPFDEGFKRAMETKHGIPSLDGANISSTSDDVLHTPHLVFPLIDSGDCALFSTTNNQRNITISRSSSDESGAVKEYETTTISKLTNEVTTISRVENRIDTLTDDDCVLIENNNISHTSTRHSPSKHYLESRSAASRRYRERLKETMRRQSEENRQLREDNKRLTAEKAELKLIITEHLKKCPIGDDLRDIQERLKRATTGL
ncbi:unnamed protein product, partial [Iphiclides podalirius]